jgi:putative chitinase
LILNNQWMQNSRYKSRKSWRSTIQNLSSVVLNRLFPHAQPAYVDALTNDRAHQQLGEAGISDTALRLAHFVAQIAAETDGLRIAEENGNYSAARLREIFPRHFTADEAEKYAHKPEAILNRAYADRMGNGSEESGDGWRYRGRGGNQLTGRENYRRAGGHIGIDLETDPYIAAAPNYILSIALWEWSNCDLNTWADRDDVLAVSRGINCGSPTSSIKPNGLNARRAWLTKVKAALAMAPVVAENATTPQPVAFASPENDEAPMQQDTVPVAVWAASGFRSPATISAPRKSPDRGAIRR